MCSNIEIHVNKHSKLMGRFALGHNGGRTPHEFIFHGFGYAFNTLIEFQCTFKKKIVLLK